MNVENFEANEFISPTNLILIFQFNSPQSTFHSIQNENTLTNKHEPLIAYTLSKIMRIHTDTPLVCRSPVSHKNMGLKTTTHSQ